MMGWNVGLTLRIREQVSKLHVLAQNKKGCNKGPAVVHAAGVDDGQYEV